MFKSPNLNLLAAHERSLINHPQMCTNRTSLDSFRSFRFNGAATDCYVNIYNIAVITVIGCYVNIDVWTDFNFKDLWSVLQNTGEHIRWSDSASYLAQTPATTIDHHRVEKCTYVAYKNSWERLRGLRKKASVNACVGCKRRNKAW
jgi:hypothetical protein